MPRGAVAEEVDAMSKSRRQWLSDILVLVLTLTGLSACRVQAFPNTAENRRIPGGARARPSSRRARTSHVPVPVQRIPGKLAQIFIYDSDGILSLMWHARGTPVVVDELLYRYQGEAELDVTRQGARVLVNGRVVGLDLTKYDEADALKVLAQAPSVKSFLVRAASNLPERVLRAMAARGPGLSLSLPFFRGSRGALRRIVQVLSDRVSMLRLSGSLTEGMISELAGLSRLKYLELSGPSLGDAALDSVGKIRSLEGLLLLNGRYTDVGLKHLGKLAHLWFLLLTRCGDQGAQAIAQIENLEVLTVVGQAGISRVGLEALSELPRLRRLLLANAKLIDDAALQALRHLRDLRSLTLTAAPVTDAGAAELARHRELRTLVLAGTRITDKALGPIGTLGHLRWLNLAGTKVTDQGLRSMAGLQGLLALNLAGTPVTDAGLPALANLRNLRTLNLAGTKVTGAGLAGLSGLTNLRWVNLDHSGLTDGGMDALTRIPNLQALVLSATTISPNGLLKLQRLAGTLRSLDLSGCIVLNSALDILSGLKQLRYLNLRRTMVTDSGMERLARLKGLRGLVLAGQPITDQGFALLGGLSNLRYLDLGGTRVSMKAAGSFAKAHPGCEVYVTLGGIYFPPRP